MGMRKIAIAVAGLALAGCVVGPPVVVASATPTAILLRVHPEVQMQTIEDRASQHCAAYGLVPRLAQKGPFNVEYLSFRYECETPPVPMAVPKGA